MRKFESGTYCRRIFGLFVVLVFSALHASADPQFLGDLDEDGKATVADVVLLSNHIAGTALLGSSLDFFADLDENGAIDQVDLNLLVNAAAGGSSLPRPGDAPRLVPLPQSTASVNTTVTGRTLPGSQVRISGGAAPVIATADGDGNFSAVVTLLQNRRNRLAVARIAPNGGLLPARFLGTVHDAVAPEVYVDFPANASVVTAETATIAGRVGDFLSGYQGLGVTVNGQDADVIIGIGTNGTFELAGLPLALGDNDFEVIATDIHGNQATTNLSITRVTPQGTQIMPVSGGAQHAEMHQFLPNPIIVQVVNADGTPFAEKVVDFNVIRSNGRLFASPPQSPEDPGALLLQVRTDAAGLARAYWMMGSDAGCGNNRLSVTSAGIANGTFFCASADAGPAHQINVGSGTNQRTAIGAPALNPLRAWVNDMCNGVAGVDVTFSVIAGDGKVNGADRTVVSSSVTGHAEVIFSAGLTPGTNIVEANFPGNQNDGARFVVQGLGSNGRALATFSGVVLNNANQPLGGVDVELKVNGTLETPAVTNADGTFRFEDVPSGSADLHLIGGGVGKLTVDGTPIAAAERYPDLHFETMIIADADNALPTPIFLPVMNTANDRTYDPAGSEDVVLTVAGMEGLKMTVKAGSVKMPNGDPVTGPITLALNQVHHDEIPMPMPDGAAPPFAWTLQPGGMQYDPPVEITYPNMAGLPAGALAYFLSFNHDTNEFEIIATGTVSNDGSDIVSDPGVGIRTAGWGGNCPPYPVTGKVENCKNKCIKTGSISGGSAAATDTSVHCVGEAVVFKITDEATDNGGEKERTCGDNPPVTIELKGTPTYTWEIKRAAIPAVAAIPPNPAIPGDTGTPAIPAIPETTVASGGGKTASYSPTMGGTYSATFEATVARECPPDPITISATGTVPVVSIDGIEVSPSPVEPVIGKTAQARATTTPAGHAVTWTIEDNGTGASIDANTGVVTINTTTAGQPNVIAKLKDPAAAACPTKKGSFCIGGSETTCCRDVTVSKSFGPITVTFGQNVIGKQEGECCRYTVKGSDGLASVTLRTVVGLFPAKEAVLTPSPEVANFSVSWLEDPEGALKSATIEWDGRKNLGEFGPIKGDLIKVRITVDKDGKVTGQLLFEAILTQEVSVHDIAYLQPDLSGQFSYDYSVSNTFNGSFNFQGVENIEIHLKKGNKKIARATATSFTKDGTLENVLLALEPGATYTTNAFKAELLQLDVRFNYSIGDVGPSKSRLQFISGAGRIKLTDIQNIDGHVELGLTFLPDSITVSVEVDQAKAFDTTISGTLSATFNYSFDVLPSITGTDISIKHDEFDQSFTGINFEIKRGELEKFSFDAITVKYKEGVEFSIKNASYEKAKSKLKFDADVMVPGIALGVEDFEISGDGKVSVGRIKATIDDGPMFVDIDIRFKTNEFEGKVVGKFGGKVEIEVDVLVGATPGEAGYNYGKFGFRIRIATGVPIGQSGLKVTTLLGEFGYNYIAAVVDATGAITTPGHPEKDALLIGFGLGISDIGDIVALEGSIRIQIASSSVITLTGNVKITANSPHYLNGTTTVSYAVNSGEVMGSIASTVKIPPSDGKALTLNSGSINFAIKNSKWSVNGSSMTGSIFERVDITASVNLSAPLRSPFRMSGSLGGTLTYSNNFSFAFPSGFDPSSCANADATDFAGFGAKGNIDFTLSGGFNATLDRRGVNGCISVSTSGNGSVDYKLPCLFCGDSCVSTQTASFSGSLKICKDGNTTTLTGNVTVNIPGVTSREVGVDLTI